MRFIRTGLAGLPIHLKITLVGFAGIIGMLLIAFAGQFGDSLRAHVIADVQSAAQIQGKLLQTSANVHQMRALEMEWLLRRQDSAATVHADVAKATLAALADIRAAISGNDEIPASFADKVKSIETLAQDYAGTFVRQRDAQQKMAAATPSAEAQQAALDGFHEQSMRRFKPLLDSVTAALTEFKALQSATVAEHAATMDSILDLTKLASLLAIFVLGIVATLIGYRIGAALQSMNRAIHNLAQGSFDIELPNKNRRDEIGAMAQGIDSFRNRLMEKTRHDAERDIAMKMEVDFERRSAAQELADQFEATVSGIIDEVTRLSTDLQNAAGSLADTARMSERASGHVSQASEEVATTAMSVAQASDEMSSSIAAISQRLDESNRIAQEAVAQITQTNKRMENLASATSKIDDIVNLISGIAKQTNLLALNATIEAARAGEAGRGFAVVAQEVKALANQTAQATASITNQIAAMLNASRDSVDAITDIGKTVMLMSQFSTEIALAIAQQSSATQEIARNTQLSAENTGEITQRIHEISTGASATGNAAGQLLASARQLGSESAHLRSAVNEFLDTVRAA